MVFELQPNSWDASICEVTNCSIIYIVVNYTGCFIEWMKTIAVINLQNIAQKYIKGFLFVLQKGYFDLRLSISKTFNSSHLHFCSFFHFLFFTLHKQQATTSSHCIVSNSTVYMGFYFLSRCCPWIVFFVRICPWIVFLFRMLSLDYSLCQNVVPGLYPLSGRCPWIVFFIRRRCCPWVVFFIRRRRCT